MTGVSAISIFSTCVVLMIISSFALSHSLDKLKKHFHISGGMLGMIAALGAATPEISSAIAALFVKQNDVGIGIVVGSNIFNLAALLGIPALFAEPLLLKRSSTIFNGTISLMATLIIILLVFNFISSLISALLLLIVLIPYVFISGLKTDKIKRWKSPLIVRNFIIDATTSDDIPENSKTPMPKLWTFIGGTSLIVIVFSSMEIVRSAIFLSDAWKINKTILGVIVLAFLTGIPDMITAIRMALHGKGVAVMSEALNSNNLNIFFGICIPTILFGVGNLLTQTIFSIWWLLGVTILNLLLLYFMKGFNRISGVLSVTLYLTFIFIIFMLN